MKHKLKPHHISILKLLAKGYSPKEIAHILKRSPKTVRNHLRKIQKMTGTPSHAALAMLAVRTGMASPPPIHHKAKEALPKTYSVAHW